MKLLVDVKVFKKFVERLASVAPKSPIIQSAVYAYLFISDGVVYGTATDTRESITLPLAAEINKEGEMLFPVHDAIKLLKGLSGEAMVHADGKNIHFKCGKVKAKWGFVAASTFPSVEHTPEGGIKVKAKAVADALRRAATMIMVDMTRANLSGPYTTITKGHIQSLGISGYGIVEVERDVEGLADGELEQFLVHLDQCDGLIKAFHDAGDEATVVVSDNRVFVSHDGYEFSARLLGKSALPQYKMLIPPTEDIERTFTFDVAEIVDTLDRASYFSESGKDSAPSFFLALESGSVFIRSVEDVKGSFEEEVSAEIEGEASDFSVAFQHSLFSRILRAIEGAKKLKVSFKDKLSPAIISSDEVEGVSSILMPIRVE